MSGWQRLFVLLVLVCGVPLLGIWTVIYSDIDDTHYAYYCDLENDYLTADRARRYVRDREIPASDLGAYRSTDPKRIQNCWGQIEAVASGDATKKEEAEARKDLYVGTGAFAVFFGLVYALGAGLGWVWRGFFPRKAN